MREVVIAHYNENLDWLSIIPDDCQITIYAKGNVPSLAVIADIIQLTNQGREGDTFLSHVINRYDSLSDVTIFLQGNPFDHVSESELASLLSYDYTQPIGTWLYTDASGNPNHPGLPIEDFARQIGIQTSFPLGFSAGAQWIVGKDSILSKPRSFYENARRVLLTDPIYGYCLERLWPIIWDEYSTVTYSDVYGLLYTHHKVPDNVLKLMLATVDAMGIADDKLVISCHRPDSRLPEKARKVYLKPANPHWIPSIYEQMIAGLEVIPSNAWVLTLEHDVLYPITYLDTMRDKMIDPSMVYYYTLVRHLDLFSKEQTGFWASDPNGTRTLQSCCGGQAGRLLSLAKRDLAEYYAGSLKKDFELGITDRWARVDAEQPVLDIRQGSNSTSTGYDKSIHFQSDYLPYWGQAKHLRQRLL